MNATEAAGPTSTLGALRHEQFRLLFGGLLASNVGIWMQEFALGWLVVEVAVRDGNPTLAGFYLGLRSFASALPALAFGLFAGVFTDRMDRRDLLTGARIASALVAVALALVVIADRATIVVVMFLSAAASAAFAFDPPGRQAILSNVVPVRDIFSGMGLVRASMQVARTVGPLIAGVLIVPAGVGGVLLAKAGLDLTSVGAMLRMKAQPAEATARDIGILGSLREGLDHMRRDDLIRGCAILQVVFAILAVPFSQLLPAVAFETLRGGAGELSWLVAATGVGALVGAVFVAGSGEIGRRGLLMLGGMFVTGALLALLGLQRGLIGALVVLAALGAIQQVFMGTQAVVLQLAAPDRLRGRVMSMQSVIFMSCGPLGVLAVGTLGTFIGVSNAILLAGVGVAAVALVAAARIDVIRNLSASNQPSHSSPDAGAALL